MEFVVCDTYEELSAAAGQRYIRQLQQKPDSVLGFATGSTPLGLYRFLAEQNRLGVIDFSRVTTFNLDEYYPMPPTHCQSYRYFMDRNLFDCINIDKANTFVPPGDTDRPEEAARQYDEQIRRRGGIDLQLLGVGHNGHIGFNEPCDSFVKETHVVDLTQSTIDANARFFASADDVPRQALTMGIGCIMAARRVLLIASGADKADAVYNAFCGPIDPHCPASILQLHNDVVLVGDKAALSKLTAAGVPVCE